MQCPRCQHENPAGMKFCEECAASLSSTCPSCGAANPPEHKFCGQCAAPLSRRLTAGSSSPGSYNPKYLAEQILNSRPRISAQGTVPLHGSSRDDRGTDVSRYLI